jgi:hypothetical protein
MGEARSQVLWNHTSSVLAMLANIHRDAKRSKVYHPADFNPHAKKRIQPRTMVGIEALNCAMRRFKTKESAHD